VVAVELLGLHAGAVPVSMQSILEQIAESARRHRAGEAGLVLIAVESDRLADRLKWEKSRGGALFPHLYGALDPAEAGSVRPLPLGPNGEHLFPPLDYAAVLRVALNTGRCDGGTRDRE